MRHYGLIGKILSHSFSRSFFEEKFKDEGLDCSYSFFELENIGAFLKLIEEKQLSGLNVTIPYKEAIIPFLDVLDAKAEKIGAVNTIAFKEGKTIGYNTDYHGFEQALSGFVAENFNSKALILGTGGASKAVQAVLADRGIVYTIVSRTKGQHQLTYLDLNKEILSNHHLIINTTPLGMYPDAESFPPLNYEQLSDLHYCFDLVYNPEATIFLEKASESGAKTSNGILMLELQAEKAWEIWNE